MRSDRDQRTDKELEIDDFLSQFDTPLDDYTTDINSYLGDNNSTKYTAANTFYGKQNYNYGGQQSAPTSSNVPPTNSYSAQSQSSNESNYTVQDMLRESGLIDEPTPASGNGDDGGDKKSKKKFSFGKKNKDGKNDNKYTQAAKDAPAPKGVIGAKLKAFFASLKGKPFKEKLSLTLAALFLIDNPNYDPNGGEYIVVNGKRVKNKPTKVSFKKILRDIIVFGITCMLIGMLYALVVITFAPKINADDIYATVSQSSIVLDDEGNQVSSVFYTEDRKIIEYKDCPKDLVNAFVAIEDKTFWKHHGFNWVRMFGAVLQSVVGGGSISGTSTITQQLARNVYLADIKSVRSIKRKILEMYYAAQIEACMSKEEIIEAYMNTIYLGYGCYGVTSAARAYFSKNVQDLTLVECAALAALPQAPEYYALIKFADEAESSEAGNIVATSPDVLVANDISKDRRDLTLELMKDQGYIKDADCKAAQSQTIMDYIKPTFKTTQDTNSYFKEYMVDEVIEDLMEEYDLEYEDAEKMVYTGGLKIYSTLDSTAQAVCVKELEDDDNYCGIGSLKTNGNGDAVDESGNLIMYKYSNYFDGSGNFVFGPDEIVINEDGSVTIKRGLRVNIYKTKSNGVTDYNLEFNNIYLEEGGELYTISGGVVNIPAEYKKLDKDKNLVIDKKFFKSQDLIRIEGTQLVVGAGSYTLHPKTIQPQAAMVIVGVGTGEIKAMVGGHGVKGQRLYNRCLTPRQPGSSIKPLAVYGAALQKSFELAKAGKTWTYTKYNTDKQNTKGYGDYITCSSPIIDEKMIVGGKQWPWNSSNTYSGNQTFRTAIQQSLNTCAVKIQMQVGNDFSIKMLKKFGITSLVLDGDANDKNAAALALGGMARGLIPLESACAYASFPNNGVRNEPISYTKVCDRNGKVVLKNKSKTHKVMDAGVAWIMCDVLQSCVSRGIAGAASVSGVQSGGKTGTTNSNYDIWFSGFTPTYAASIWMGCDTNIRLNNGSNITARVWGKIMRQIPKACTGSYKKMPDNVVKVGGEYYTKGTEKGLSTYISDIEKNKGLVPQIDAFWTESDVTISIETACAQYGITYEDYKDAGGTIAEGAMSKPKEKEPEEEEDTGGGSTTGGTTTGDTP